MTLHCGCRDEPLMSGNVICLLAGEQDPPCVCVCVHMCVHAVSLHPDRSLPRAQGRTGPQRTLRTHLRTGEQTRVGLRLPQCGVKAQPARPLSSLSTWPQEQQTSRKRQFSGVKTNEAYGKLQSVTSVQGKVLSFPNLSQEFPPTEP